MLYNPGRRDTAIDQVLLWSAVLLASIGLYGVLSFQVARRTREIGIRMALGSSRREVLGLVLRQGASLVGLSIAAAWWFTASVAATSMEPGLAPIQALSFTGPSAEVLTRVLFAVDKPPTPPIAATPSVIAPSATTTPMASPPCWGFWRRR